MEMRMTEIIEFWDFNLETNIITHLPCCMAWFFELDSGQISEITKRECLDHQRICPMKSPASHKISREEWDDNMQKSREKNAADKKRDDIFQQIFN